MTTTTLLALLLAVSPYEGISGSSLSEPATVATVSLTELGKTCAKLPPMQTSVDACVVLTSSRLPTIAGQRLHYALYCYSRHAAKAETHCPLDSPKATVIFEELAGGRAALVIYATDRDGWLEQGPPKILRAQRDIILTLPFVGSGTFRDNLIRYYVWRSGWQRLDTNQWLSDLQKRLPPGGHAGSHGIFPKLESLSGEVPLYKKGDPNCCPSAGLATVKFAIQANALSIESLTITPIVDGE
jgi:hypothetical protein